MSVKKYCFNILFLFFVLSTVSAQKATIKGTVFDDQNTFPIEYASVALLNSLDNSVISGSLTNKNGGFTIKNINAGKYKLKIYFVGYQ